MERGLSWEKALEIYRKTLDSSDDNYDNDTSNCSPKPQGFYISNQTKNNHRIAVLAIPFIPTLPNLSSNEDALKLSECLFLAIYRPNTGLQVRQETPESLLKKYKRVNVLTCFKWQDLYVLKNDFYFDKVSPADAKPHWNEQFFKSAQQCTHVYRQAHCSNMRNCEVGLRTRRFHILAGSVLTVWTKVENLLSTLTGSSQFRLQIIRVKTDDNQKIVGCVIPTMCLKQIDVLLNSMSGRTYVQSHSNKIDGLKYEHELPTPAKEIDVISHQIKVNHTSNLTKQITPVVQKFKMSNQFASNSQMPTGAAPPATIKNLNKFSNQIINYEFTWNVVIIIIAYLKNKIKKKEKKKSSSCIF